ncbi:hypothetical protein QQS21_007880 [Conoideocrella luteorostrata]|uniref:Mid2 domain-containing protein n=1 Tax=Conoideocrella luteorostrata TaxID=1105319 RepID=A0AAJ0CPA7_9HYPO|nr:hypothetical protein QQS21_007880 [Conoideocrella luteorostrata]
MRRPRSLLLLPFLTSLIPATLISAREVSWRVSNLTLELTDFVPACAESCFLSFLQANYGLERGAKIPSLVELCSTDGDTGFTLGEGAVQCIVAERSIDNCADKDANSSVIYSAHQMCANQPDAITPTHGVLTATLVRPPQGGGAISYPAPSRTTHTWRFPKTTSLPTTLVVDTGSSTSTAASSTTEADSTLRTSRTSTGTQSASETSTPATSAVAAANSGKPLTPLQKAGIAVGVIGFAIIVVGFLLLFRLYRAKKKRQHAPLSGTPPRRDSWGYRFDKNHGRSASTGGEQPPPWITNPAHPPQNPNGSSTMPIPPVTSTARAMPPVTTATASVVPAAAARALASTGRPTNPPAPPRAYNRTSWRPSTIGLAISPAASKNNAPATPISRPLSRLLPAKPLLALAIPKKSSSTLPTKHADVPPSKNQSETPPSPKYTRVASHPPVLPKLLIPHRHDDFLNMTKTTNKPRESTMTEFEEDGRESSSISPEGQIWRPPSAAPQSAAATYYVADKHGNWVLGDTYRISQAAELEGTTPLSAYPKMATSMTILPIVSTQPNADPAPAPAPAPLNLSSVRAARRSSSAPYPPPLAAKQSIRVVTEPPLKLQDAQEHVVPRALFSGSNSASARGTSAAERNLTRPRAPSADSGVTTIATSSSSSSSLSGTDSDLSLPNVQPINLSPVAESPRSGNGRSPVSYPKIPGRETGPTGTTPAVLVPPPRMPILYKPSGQNARSASSRVEGANSSSVPAPLNTASTRNMDHDADANANADAAMKVTPRKEPKLPTIVPLIPTTTVASPPNQPPSSVSSSQRLRKPTQDPSLLRTGSPTLRIVRPSPAPEDDRAMLPSAHPGNTLAQSVQPTQKQPAQLQPSPFPAGQQPQQPQQHQQQQRQQQLNQHLYQHQHQQRPYETRLQQPPQPQAMPVQQIDAQNEPPRPQQQQQQQQQHPLPPTQQDQQHSRKPTSNWIPGLPAHPHPQRRPQHTSTLWLPPQARSNRKIETEPEHHQLTPRRAQLHLQAPAASLETEAQPESHLYFQPQPQPHINPREPDEHTLRIQAQPQPQPRPQLHQSHVVPSQHQHQNPTSFRARQQHQHLQPPQSRPHPPPPQHHNHQYPIHPPQQRAYVPYANPRPYPNQHPTQNLSHHYPPFYPQSRPPAHPQPQPHLPGQQDYHQHPPVPQMLPTTLLAKRLGRDRAVNMSISTNNLSSSSLSSNQPNNWHRGSSGLMYLSPEAITPQQGQSGDLPSTPTWLPTLTPTRRGADLYLNVK